MARVGPEPPTYGLYLIATNGDIYRVGPRGRHYEECREHARVLNAALKHREIIGYQGTTIQPDDSLPYQSARVLEGGLLPGLTWTTLGGAGRAVAAHFGMAVCAEGHLLDPAGQHTFRTHATLGAELRRLGVVTDTPEGGYRLARMPRSAELRGYQLGARQGVGRRRWMGWDEAIAHRR